MKKKTEEKIVVRAKLNRSLPAENLHFTSLCYSPASTWPYLIIYLKNGNGILPTHTSLKMKKDRMKESSCNCNSCSCMSEYRCWLLHELASLRNGCCMHCSDWETMDGCETHAAIHSTLLNAVIIFAQYSKVTKKTLY